MTTIVNRTIGIGKEYSTIQAWEDALPTDLTRTRTNVTGSGSTTSQVVLDAGASAVDNFYTGLVLIISGESRLITNYVGATLTATVGSLNNSASTFSSAPSVSTAYVVDAIAAVGMLANQIFSGTTNMLSISGETTSSTSYIKLTTDTGCSFVDHPQAATNPLRIDATKGALIITTGGYLSAVSAQVNNCIMEKLQIHATSTGSNPLYMSNFTGHIVQNCILQGTPRNNINNGVIGLYGGNNIIRNCLCIVNSGGTCYGIDIGNGGSAVNCTIVRPSNFTAIGKPFIAPYISSIVRNCALFGFTTAATGVFNADGHNACESTGGTLPGSTGNLTTVPYDTTTFVNPNNATNTADFRLVTGSTLIDAGVTDSTDVPSVADIVGTARPFSTNWDIGAWEFQYKAKTYSGFNC